MDPRHGGQWQTQGFYDDKTMNKMFEEFVKKIKEEEDIRRDRKRQATASFDEFASRRFRQSTSNPGRDEEWVGGSANDFFDANSTLWLNQSIRRTTSGRSGRSERSGRTNMNEFARI